ncbi:polyhydroxyalkanoic acid system family protein [soil metagenome]
MAQIDISRSHNLGLKGAREAAKSISKDLARRFDTSDHWEDDSLVVSGHGVSGRLYAEPELVRVRIRLPFFFRPLRNRVEQELEAYLEQYLPESTASPLQ